MAARRELRHRPGHGGIVRRPTETWLRDRRRVRFSPQPQRIDVLLPKHVLRYLDIPRGRPALRRPARLRHSVPPAPGLEPEHQALHSLLQLRHRVPHWLSHRCCHQPAPCWTLDSPDSDDELHRPMIPSNHNGSQGDFDVLVDTDGSGYIVYSFGPVSIEKLAPDFLSGAGINASFPGGERKSGAASSSTSSCSATSSSTTSSPLSSAAYQFTTKRTTVARGSTI